jgi:hypothetical protein
MAEAQGLPLSPEAARELGAAARRAADAGRALTGPLRLAGEAIPEALLTAAGHLARDAETPALIHALDGGYVRPAPGGDLVRSPEILPTGRNLHAFDPFRMPSAFACRTARQAAELLARHARTGHGLPRSVAIVLWGADNLKTEGGPIAQALALMGARPRFDGYGRLCRGGADPARGTRPAADRRGGDALGHLPRPAAAADQDAGRGRLARRIGRHEGPEDELPPRPRPRLRRVAGLRRSRRRRCGCSPTPTGPMAPTSTQLSGRASGTARTSWPTPTRPASASPTAATAARRASRRCCRRCWRTSTSPTRTSSRSRSGSRPSTTTSTRSAAWRAR